MPCTAVRQLHNSWECEAAASGPHHEAVMEALDEPALGWTVVLRRQPIRLIEGRAEGGYTDSYELICCDCGDNPELDYRDVSADLQQIRGPYAISAGISAYGRHVRLRHRQPANSRGHVDVAANGGF
jgi:hypothetical protein